MKVRSSEEQKFLELQARAAGTPYRDILTFAERVADEIERDFEFDSVGDIIQELEKKQDIRLSMGDVGEILVILGTYWVYGERLLEQLSYIESKIVAENVEYRLSVLARQERD